MTPDPVIPRDAPPTAPRHGPVLIAWCVLAATVTAAIAALRLGPWTAPALAAVAGFGLLLAAIDIRTLRLPDRYTGTLTCCVLVWWAIAAIGAAATLPLLRAIAGALAAGAVLVALALARPGGLGLGDAKLAVGLGAALAWFGWGHWAVGLALPFVLAAAWAALLLLRRRARGSTPVPFGPFLVAGALMTALAG